MNILLVEDDHLILRMYRRIFSAEGYEVIIAENGEEGFDKAKQELPNLIFADMMMPKMTGMEFLYKLKALEKTKHIHVILLTNLSVDEEIARALDLGALQCIKKADQDPMRLLQLTKEVLTRFSLIW